LTSATESCTKNTGTALYSATWGNRCRFTRTTLEVTEHFFTATRAITFAGYFTTAEGGFFQTRRKGSVTTGSFTGEHGSFASLRCVFRHLNSFLALSNTFTSSLG
jgi:hypothetical protein